MMSDSSHRSQKPEQVQLWQDMTAVKLNIISRMDSFPAPLRIMCIKFVQKVVQVQTPGVISDPRVSIRSCSLVMVT